MGVAAELRGKGHYKLHKTNANRSILSHGTRVYSRVMKRWRFQSSCLTALPYTVCVFFLFSLIQQVQCTRAAEVAAILFYEQECKEWGFNPSQLACDTCDLLVGGGKDASGAKNDLPLANFFGECKICCQSWRVNKDPTEVGDIKPGAFKIEQFN
jgi:hypothetical protein